jgi:DNA-binding NarL/FixJ family response regulator
VTTRLVVADDHPIFLRGIAALLGAEPDLEIVATAITGEEALAALRQHRPALAVVDNHMPGPNGLEVVATARAEGLHTRFILLTADISEAQYAEALEQHVDGVVLKEEAPQSILSCVRAVLAGRSWHESTHARRALDRLISRRDETRQLDKRLTPRETQLVGLAASGLRNKEIAVQLQITEGTVKLHLHRIYTKLGLGGRLQLMRFAQERGLI